MFVVSVRDTERERERKNEGGRRKKDFVMKIEVNGSSCAFLK